MMFDFPVGRYWLNAWFYCLDRHSSFISRVFTETSQTQGIQPSCLCWKKNSACFLVQVFMSLDCLGSWSRSQMMPDIPNHTSHSDRNYGTSFFNVFALMFWLPHQIAATVLSQGSAGRVLAIARGASSHRSAGDSKIYGSCLLESVAAKIWAKNFTALADVLVIFNKHSHFFGEPELYIPRILEATNT